jgi:hypothetical protein
VPIAHFLVTVDFFTLMVAGVAVFLLEEADVLLLVAAGFVDALLLPLLLLVAFFEALALVLAAFLGVLALVLAAFFGALLDAFRCVDAAGVDAFLADVAAVVFAADVDDFLADAAAAVARGAEAALVDAFFCELVLTESTSNKRATNTTALILPNSNGGNAPTSGVYGTCAVLVQ